MLVVCCFIIFIDLLLHKEELISCLVDTNRLCMTHLEGVCLSLCLILKARQEKVIWRDLSCDLSFFANGYLCCLAGQTFTFEFVCLSSCLTPLKNKPLQVLFTLERGYHVY